VKYSIEHIIESKNVKYLFFWGHQPSRDGIITKSCLSQWWEANFLVDNVNYKTAEHYMMAQKAKLFKDDNAYNKIIACKTPGEAKKLGREVSNFNQDLWEKNRFSIVRQANYYKFNQNPLLKEFLTNTKNRVLVEASPVDRIWGVGMDKNNSNILNPKNWKGLNLLGFALMEVRDDLIKQPLK